MIELRVLVEEDSDKEESEERTQKLIEKLSDILSNADRFCFVSARDLKTNKIIWKQDKDTVKYYRGE